MADEKIEVTRDELARLIASEIARQKFAEPAPKKAPPLTKPGSHIATERGYSKGILIEPGQLVPTETPVSDRWMRPLKGDKEDRASRAAREAEHPRNDDPDLTKLSKPALEAMATERGVTDVSGLSKNDLIAAIKAAYEPQAQ